jgi:hypothetical protein
MPWTIALLVWRQHAELRAGEELYSQWGRAQSVLLCLETGIRKRKVITVSLQRFHEYISSFTFLIQKQHEINTS